MTLLVNFWYASPVGHAVEALRYCLGYHLADPSLRIHLLLNGATATELAALCPFIEKTYAVAFTGLDNAIDDPAAALANVPRTWDYVVDAGRARLREQLASFAGLRRFQDATAGHFVVRRHRGVAGEAPPAYLPPPRLELALPAPALERADRELAGAPLALAIMPAGSSAKRWLYPSAASWELIVRALRAQHPDALFCLIGKLRNDGRTRTGIAAGEIARIARASGNVLDAFDWPLIDQLALVQRCRLFLSPHTGFGFAAAAVGARWLTLSGGGWPEQFYNGVPFYSVLPEPDRYPCYSDPLPVIAEDDDGEGPRTPSMCRARIVEDLPELLEAARTLIAGRLSYEEALASHFRRLLVFRRGDRSRIGSFDGIHSRYV